MTFTFSTEQHALREAVAAFAADNSDEQAVRALAESEGGVDPAVWRTLAEQLDVVGLIVPERYGGSGAGPIELAIVSEELGKALFCGPYLSSAVLASTLLSELDDDAVNAELLPPMARGDRVATVAWDEGDGSWSTTQLTTRATRSGDGWTVTGAKGFVLDGESADTLLVVTDGPRVFAVDSSAPGVSITPLRTLDSTRKQADIAFADAPARPVGDDADAATALRRTLDVGAVMLAAEQAGGARHALDMAVGYAKERYQFGRAIGSFQAIKHMCADLLVETESAYSAAYYAAWALAEQAGQDGLSESVCLAQAFCSDAFGKVAADNIQIHGGIGFTWEHPAHLYLRRARTDAQLLGDPSRYRERYIADVAARQEPSARKESR